VKRQKNVDIMFCGGFAPAKHNIKRLLKSLGFLNVFLQRSNKNTFKAFYNDIDFFFRQNIRPKRKYKGKNEPKEDLFTHFTGEKKQTAEEKEKFYLEKYKLHQLKENSTCRNYLENLAVIELLENFLCDKEEKKPLRVLDIGSKNWFYASGEWCFFKHNSQNGDVFLDGIEIDAFRLYSDFHTRYDYAHFYIKNLENTRYIAKDFLKHNEKYDFIIWFFPFVTKYPLLEWGLPLSKFKPSEMLRHAYESLNQGGKLLIVNQDENEYAIHENLINELNIPYEKKGDFQNSFLEFERKRYCTVIARSKATKQSK